MGTELVSLARSIPDMGSYSIKGIKKGADKDYHITDNRISK